MAASKGATEIGGLLSKSQKIPILLWEGFTNAEVEKLEDGHCPKSLNLENCKNKVICDLPAHDLCRRSAILRKLLMPIYVACILMENKPEIGERAN